MGWSIAVDSRAFPRMRWAAAAWLAVWIPAYASVWGPRNFLLLCDVAVLLTCAGLWLGSPLLLSSQAVSSILADAVWAMDAGSRLFLGRHLFGGTEYMWDASFPLAVRLLSLFHLFWPVLLVWSVRRVGYDRRGLGLQIAIAGALLVVSRLAGRVANLNFAFRDPIWGLSLEPAALHLAATLAFLTAVLYLPTHLVLSRAFGRRHAL
ncbi:MAG TPA: hypothetical protein VKH65_13280 [Myxococcales bacterium]|nr:hypothetical protein [Myxococcales bacterium]